MNPYYIVVEEWNYPTESGRNVINDYDTLVDAMKCCADLVEEEEMNFSFCCGDGLAPSKFINGEHTGYIITTKMGLDDYYFSTRVIEVKPFV